MRQTQSTTIAVHTPYAPQPRPMPNTWLKPIRQMNIDAMDATIVNFTSFAERSTFGKTNDIGHMKKPKPLWITMSQNAIWRVSKDIW